jgi:hypothetical protein
VGLLHFSGKVVGNRVADVYTVLMSTTTTQKADPIGVRYLANIVDALPSYVEIVARYTNHKGEELEHKLLTRDLPRTSRRLTSLTSGFEVFDFETYLRNLQEFSYSPIRIEIPALAFEVQS